MSGPSRRNVESDSSQAASQKISRGTRTRRPKLLRIVVGAVCGVVLTAAVHQLFCKNGSGSVQHVCLPMAAPILNDVSTDLSNPPEFPEGGIGPLPESFKPKIAAYYKDLKPLKLSHSPAAVFDAAVEVAKATPRWELTHQDKDAGIIQGVATTWLLRFKDDFVIRIGQNTGAGSIVDMRSKSRVGKGDMGTNAHRIQTFLTDLAAKLG